MRRRGYKYWKVYLGGKTKLTNNAKINTFLRQAVTWHVRRQEEVTGEARERLGRHGALGSMKELGFLFGLGHLPSRGKITAGERQRNVCAAPAWFTSLGSKGACEIPWLCLHLPGTQVIPASLFQFDSVTSVVLFVLSHLCYSDTAPLKNSCVCVLRAGAHHWELSVSECQIK